MPAVSEAPRRTLSEDARDALMGRIIANRCRCKPHPLEVVRNECLRCGHELAVLIGRGFHDTDAEVVAHHRAARPNAQHRVRGDS